MKKNYKEMYEQLETSYQNLLNSLPDIIYHIDNEGFFTYINESIEILGYKPEEVIGNHFKMLIHPEDYPRISREEVLPLLEGVSTGDDYAPKLFDERRSFGRRTQNLEIRLLKKNGDEYTIGNLTAYGEISSVGFTAEITNQKKIGTLGIIRDITIRKKREDSLRKYFWTIDQNPSSILITDISGKIEYVNSQFINSRQIPPNELIDKSVNLLKSDIYDKSFYRTIYYCVMRGNAWKGKIKSENRRGDTRWELATVIPVKKPSTGEITNFIFIGEDITELINAHNNAERAKLEAEDANSAKTLFLANMSHEIRTPMTSILGFSSVLQASNIDDSSKQLAQKIKNAGESLLNIINDILDITRIESGKLELNETSFNMKSLVLEILDLFTTVANNKGINLSFDIDPKIIYPINGDPVRLRQILVNLINNAIKFTNSGSVELIIKLISCKNNKITIHFEVNDTGIGINEEKIDKIFESFYQTDNSYSRKFGGTGLGLAIVKNLIQKMGGNISVKSKENIGTTFSFDLIFDLSINPSAYKNAPVINNFDKLMKSNIKITLLDNNPIIHDIIKTIINLTTWEIINITNISQKKLKIDFLIIDESFLTGDHKDFESNCDKELCEYVKTNEIKIIMLTDYYKSKKKDFSESIVTDVLLKPFSKENLFQVIQKNL